MTKKSQLTLLLIALVLALLTTFVILKQLERWRSSHSSERTVAVVVVTKSLAPHTVVTSSDVAVQQIPASAVEAGTSMALSNVVGFYTASAWYAGQQVIPAMVVSKNTAPSFPLQIPPGDRAFTIADDSVIGVDHLISNGDRVDIVVTYASKDLGGPVAKVVLQNLLVLNADTSPQATSSPSNSTSVSGTQSSSSSAQNVHVDTLTLAVTPAQVTLLDFAVTFGVVHVVLRNPGDGQANNPPAVTVTGALGS